MSSKDTARIMYGYSIKYGIPSSCAIGFEDCRSQSYTKPCQLRSSGAQSSIIKHHSPKGSALQRREYPERMTLNGLKSEYTTTGENINSFERRESPKPLILSPVTNTQFQLVKRDVVDGRIYSHTI